MPVPAGWPRDPAPSSGPRHSWEPLTSGAAMRRLNDAEQTAARFVACCFLAGAALGLVVGVATGRRT